MGINFSKGLRVAILCTAVWLVLGIVVSLGIANEGRRFDGVMFVSLLMIFVLLPLLIVWGVVWVRSAPNNAIKIEDLLIGVPLAPEIHCPRCGAQMKLKTTKSGPNAGKVFWGCSRFPVCIQIAPLSAGALEREK